MAPPRGYLQTITTALKRLVRTGDVEGFRAYVRSDTFLAAFNGLAPERRRRAVRSFAQAEALCEAKARHPLVKPKRKRSRDGRRIGRCLCAEWGRRREGRSYPWRHARFGPAGQKAVPGLRAKSNHRQNAVNAAATAICGEGTPPAANP
jgi:hypothetical protein